MSLLRFGNFELDVSHRKLTESGTILQLGGKAFDILTLLATSAGEIISKETLLQKVWPDTTVDEGALRVHLVTLRKLLGDQRTGRYIENVPSRGYVFVMPVQVVRPDAMSSEVRADPGLPRSLPRLTDRLIGRDEVVSALVASLTTSRVVTIAGAGGVGKTSVALAVGDIISRQRGVLFIDLASLGDDAQIVPTIAAALGLNTGFEGARREIVSSLADRDVLLVLDNCEHLISAVAILVEDILTGTESTSILTTSREPLRVSGERVKQLASLSVPPEDASDSEVGSYPSVQLFIDRVLLSSEHEQFEAPETMRSVASIVRRLDGIPLAIELAASGVANLGLAHLVGSLDNPLSVLRRGRRTAPPRQQTLRATLDWSFNSLTDMERLLFRYTAMFSGAFTIKAAASISALAISNDDFDLAFDGLFLKSLLSVGGGDGKYRLLQTTRAYALEKVQLSGDEHPLRLAHTTYCETELSHAGHDWTILPTSEWMARYGDLIHDVRSASSWAFETKGASAAGIRIAVNSKILWMQLGLMNEQIDVLERALAAIPGSEFEGSETELELRAARGSALYHTRGFPADGEALVELERAVEIAERSASLEKIVHLQGGLTAILCSHGRYGEAIERALRLRALHTEVPPETFSRMLEHNYFFYGDFDASRRELAGSLLEASGTVKRTANHALGFDQRIIALAVQVFIDFLEGRTATALDTLEASVAEARSLDYSIASCLLLMLSAVPMAFLAGRSAEAAGYLDTVEEIAKHHRLSRWLQWIASYRKAFATVDEGQDGLETKLTEAIGLRLEYVIVMAGERTPIVHLNRALAGQGGWCRAELLRLKAIAQFPSDRDTATSTLEEATALARSVGMPFWELRCALTAHRFAIPGEAHLSLPYLEAVLKKFDPCSRTSDLADAARILGRGVSFTDLSTVERSTS
jgi:predicted ATPase/DNA-binding winged helix-turn-helix (wHTH) protein